MSPSAMWPSIDARLSYHQPETPFCKEDQRYFMCWIKRYWCYYWTFKQRYHYIICDCLRCWSFVWKYCLEDWHNKMLCVAVNCRWYCCGPPRSWFCCSSSVIINGSKIFKPAEYSYQSLNRSTSLLVYASLLIPLSRWKKRSILS